MNATDSDPVLVVVQLTGGNDFMNTVIPYTNPLYHDARPGLRFAEDEVLPINDTLAFNPHAAPLKDVYDMHLNIQKIQVEKKLRCVQKLTF